MIGIIALTVVYCFGEFNVINSRHSEFLASKSASHKEYRPDFVKFCTVFSELKSHNLDIPPERSSGKYHGFSRFIVATLDHERLVDIAISQVADFLERHPINARKSNFIFPFHYFW